MTPISVLVDGRSLGGDGAFRGFGRYLRSMLEALADHAELEVSALVERDVQVPLGVRAHLVRRRAPGRWAALEHDLLLPWGIAREQPDVFHAPGHDPPRRCRPPWVQTIHDVIPITSNDPAYRVAKARWRVIAQRMRAADAFIVNSHHTAAEAVRALEIDPALVHVAHHGVGPPFRPGEPGAIGEPPYALLATEYGPNKGYPEAFAAIGVLAERGSPIRLKVTGRLAPWVRPEVESLRAASTAPERIELLGYVPDAELVRLHQRAVALVVTSSAEGFGLPALEAMACGTPVVAFAGAAMKEVVDDAGVLVEVGDVGALASALQELLEQPTMRAEWSARAVERADQFTWARCASIHAEVYASLAESRGQ